MENKDLMDTIDRAYKYLEKRIRELRENDDGLFTKDDVSWELEQALKLLEAKAPTV